MSCDQLIDRGRGAPKLRKCDEVQERGNNNLGWVETQEQEEPAEKVVMWCWEYDMCDVRTLDWRHINVDGITS